MRSAAAGGAQRNNKKLHDDVTVEAPVMYGNSELQPRALVMRPLLSVTTK